MARIVPLRGTEAARQAVVAAGLLLPGEIHGTTDRRRFFLEEDMVGPWVWHGAVADEAAMLALNATAGRGCWPGDRCLRSDVGRVYLCIDGHGEAAEDWTAEPGIADPTTTNGDILIRAAGVLTRLPIGSADYVLKVVSGQPAWAPESGGGDGAGGKLYLFETYH